MSDSENLVPDYGWEGETAPESCNWIAPQIIQIARDLKLTRILDLGSGNGALCAVLSDGEFDVVGVEYDQKGCELARSLYPKVPFYRYGVQDDPADLMSREAPFDAVVSTEVVEHLFSPHFLPRFASSVLKPGGYLIVSTPYHGYLKNLALSLFDHWDTHHTALWHGGHIKFWSRTTLTRLLADNGFQVVGFHGVGRLAYFWKSMILVAVRSNPR